MLIILSSLGFNTNNTFVDFTIALVYLLSLILYVINQFNYSLPFFRHPKAQFFMITSKIAGPLFIVFPRILHFLFYIYFLTIMVIEMVVTSENKDKGKPNLLFLYKFLFLLSFIATLLYYILEVNFNN